MADPQQFALKMAKFTEKVKDAMDSVVRKVVLDVGTRLVMRSPVGDPSHWASPAPKGYTGGHFRANWQYATGAAPQGMLSAIDKTGRVSIERITSGLGKSGKAYGKVHWLANNLPYAMRLETGWSKQAPSGMVGLTIREFQSIMQRIAKEVRR